MYTEGNVALIRDLYAAFGRGDLPTILAAFAPELEDFGVNARGRSRAPWHVRATTRQGVAEYFERLLGALEPLRFEPQHFAAVDDYVYVTLNHEYKVRENGRVVSIENGVHRFKIRDGLVVGWFGTEDTQLTMEALA